MTTSFDSDLLSLCALLRWFNAATLAALGVGDGAARAALLASADVVAQEYPPDSVALSTPLRTEALAALRAVDPNRAREISLRERLLRYFLAAMQADGPQQPIAEAEALYHLDEFFVLRGQRGEWAALEPWLEAAAVRPPRLPAHRHALRACQGFVAIRVGREAEGVAMLEALLAEPNLPPRARLRALNGLAQAHHLHARFDLALARYEEMEAVARASHETALQGTALLNMSMVFNDLTLYEQALDLALRSLERFRELGDAPRATSALYEAGHTSLQLGRWRRAQALLAEALATAEATPIRVAQIRWAQALLSLILGEEADSERLYRAALAIAQAPATRHAPIASDTLWHLAFLLDLQGRHAEALAAYDSALDLALEARQPHAATLIRFGRGRLFHRMGQRAAARVAYAEAIETIEALRGSTQGDALKIGMLGSVAQLYEATVGLCLEEGREADAFDMVERARSRALLDSLARDTDLADALDQPTVTLAELQAQLPAGALLLEWFAIGVRPPGETLLNRLPPENQRLRDHLTLPPQLLLFAVTRDHFAVHPIALDPNALQPKPGAASPMRRLLRDRTLAELYTRLLAPVEPQLRACDLLFLLPHGPLHYVPFMALRSPTGRFLLDADGPAIAFAPSATILLRSCLGRPTGQGEGFLALGYNDEGAAALRYAEAEASVLARLMGGDGWVGAEPKWARLVAHHPPARWLHLSGHGHFHPQDPLASELRLGAADAPSARAIMGELRLAADLVTLSACTSGLTRAVPGDELLGLPRAFLLAGAPTVVCTPWEAADLVALLVMEHFYQAIREGRSPALALRDAQVAARGMTGRDLLATLARWRATYPAEAATFDPPPLTPDQLAAPLFAHPEHWALFMLIGRP